MLSNYFYENILMLFGYNLRKAKKEISRVKKLSRDDFKQWQETKRWEIVKYHFNNNNFYKEKVGSIIPNKWDKLPIIEKKHIQQNPVNAISRSFQNLPLYKANTSGSSGIPLNFVKDKYCHARSWVTIKNLYALHNIKLGSKEARFYGIPKDLLGYTFERVKDIILNRKRFIIFDMSPTVLNKFITRFTRHKFVYIYGYTNSIVLFSEYLIKRKIILKNICPSLKKVIVTAELCSQREKDIIEKGTGVQVINEYGASECSIIAFECKKGFQHIIEENLFVENNKKGEILITDLFNKAMPFIRYNIGDIGELEGFTCECNFEDKQVLTNLIGRTNDTIFLPNGQISPGLTFFYISREILQRSGGVIKEMVVRQTAINKIELDVVSEKEFNEKDKIFIKTQIVKYLGQELNIFVNNLNSIPKPQSGKIKPFISEIYN